MKLCSRLVLLTFVFNGLFGCVSDPLEPAAIEDNDGADQLQQEINFNLMTLAELQAFEETMLKVVAVHTKQVDDLLTIRTALTKLPSMTPELFADLKAVGPQLLNQCDADLRIATAQRNVAQRGASSVARAIGRRLGLPLLFLGTAAAGATCQVLLSPSTASAAEFYKYDPHYTAQEATRLAKNKFDKDLQSYTDKRMVREQRFGKPAVALFIQDKPALDALNADIELARVKLQESYILLLMAMKELASFAAAAPPGAASSSIETHFDTMPIDCQAVGLCGACPPPAVLPSTSAPAPAPMSMPTTR